MTHRVVRVIDTNALEHLWLAGHGPADYNHLDHPVLSKRFITVYCEYRWPDAPGTDLT